MSKIIKFIVVVEENDDEELIKPNIGQANTEAIGPGPNGVFDSVIDPTVSDDEIVNGKITTGLNGIRETVISGDDVKLNNIELNQGLPNAPCVGIGGNGFWDTPEPDPLFTDDYIDGNYILTGPDGICQTAAKKQNELPQHLSNYDLSEAITYLNSIYQGAVTSFDPEPNPVVAYTEAINYDFDRDGKLFLGDGSSSSQPTTEMIAILDNSQFYTPAQDIVFVFIADYGVDDDGADDIDGFGPMDLGYMCLFVGQMGASGRSQTYFGKALAHELGHAGFGLQHPFSQFSTYLGPPYFDPTDPENVMDYGSPDVEETRLRKYQWDEIHQN